MSSTPPPAGGPSEHVSDEDSEVQVDIPNVDISHSGSSAEDISGVDISQPDNSDVPLELDIPRLDKSTSSDPDLGSHLDSHAILGDDWPPSELGDVTASIELPQLQIAQLYIDLLRSASLDSSGMLPDDIHNLCNLGQEHTLDDPSPLLRSI